VRNESVQARPPETACDYQQALRAHQQGDLAVAERAYREILRRDPNHAGAWHFWGVIGLVRGDYASARKRLERALLLCDTKAVYWNNYGVLLKETGDHRAAEAALHRALDLNRQYADAWSNLGHLQHLLRRPPGEVEQSLRNALALAADHIDATFHLADLYQACGRHGDAVAQYRRGLQLEPDRPGGYRRLGDALVQSGQWQDARQALDEAAARDPRNPGIHLAAAFIHGKLEETDAVKRACRTAASLRPDRLIWRWKHLGICPTVFADEESIAAYWSRLRAELAESLEETIDLDWRTLPADGYTPSFNLPHHGRCCREVRELFAARFEPAFPQRHPQPSGTRAGRIGFLVTAGHEPGFLRGMAGVIGGLDPRFEVVVFCSQGALGRCHRAIRRDDVRYVAFLPRFEAAVDAVRGARCDVLFFRKIGPDPWSYFLPMARLAPVQCTATGCHGTSGLSSVDYYLSSQWMESTDPTVDSARHYTERLVLLDTFPMLQRRQPAPKDVSRAEFDLPQRGALYFCPHRLPKYCPSFDFDLRDLLEADEHGTVILVGGADGRARGALQTRMRRNLGEDCFRRLRFLPTMPVKQYYRLFQLATLMLDTPVYASSLTAYDAFSLGVPVLTRPGALAVQCYATGLYRQMGMDGELVVHDRRQYVAKAVKMGTEPEYRQHLVRMLQERDHAAFDDRRVIAEYERFFSSVIEKNVTIDKR